MGGLIRGCCFELSLRLSPADWEEDEPVAAPRSLRTPFISPRLDDPNPNVWPQMDTARVKIT